MEDEINNRILLWASNLSPEELKAKVGSNNTTKEAVIRAYWREYGLNEDQPTLPGMLLNE